MAMPEKINDENAPERIAVAKDLTRPTELMRLAVLAGALGVSAHDLYIINGRPVLSAPASIAYFRRTGDVARAERLEARLRERVAAFQYRSRMTRAQRIGRAIGAFLGTLQRNWRYPDGVAWTYRPVAPEDRHAARD